MCKTVASIGRLDTTNCVFISQIVKMTDKRAEVVNANQKSRTLTAVEQQILQLLGEGKKVREISEILQQDYKTVEKNKQILLDKLQARSVRHGRNQPIGVFVALKKNDEPFYRVAFSTCHSRKDTFDREFGTTLAINRALQMRKKVIPASIAKQFAAFEQRAAKYFKGCESLDALPEEESVKTDN